MKYFGIILSFFFCINLSAQEAGVISEANKESLHTYEDTISLLAYAIVNDSIKINRFAACKQIILTLKEALQTENSFNYKFDRAQAISIQYPADNSFRIFTWQLYVDKDEYRYFGAIQMNTSDLKLYPLIDRSADIEASNIEQFELSPEQWYGALYYKIKQTTGPSGKYYLLFGFDAYRFFHKRKLIDVLSFKDGKPVFGASIFSFETENKRAQPKKRFLLQYSPDASVTLNFDESRNMIIFDNLMTITGQYGEGPTKIPDGTYQGFELKDGIWVHIDKIFNQILDEPPVSKPVLGSGAKKDIFGN